MNIKDVLMNRFHKGIFIIYRIYQIDNTFHKSTFHIIIGYTIKLSLLLSVHFVYFKKDTL